VYTFSTWWSASQYAENLKDEGKISFYIIEERQAEPTWILLETCSSRDEAEARADDAEMLAAHFGLVISTKIVCVYRLVQQTSGSLLPR
ncbi:MAG: hypothetical protein KDA85_18600, partial [Planctomycetaceae bacterium]|nr:hypothetical protein [Planctomycetaceae bacterium]